MAGVVVARLDIFNALKMCRAAMVAGVCLANAPAAAEDFWSGSAQEQRPISVPVSEGAIPGFVADGVCSDCHQDVAHEFAGHGMGRSWYRPSAEKVIEDFSQSYYHAPSDRHYQMWLDGDDYWFKRYRLAEDGTEMDVFAHRIDWIVGSGNHSRVYLIRTENGSLLMMPLAWYSQSQSWAMAPGYEFPDHLGLQRIVRRRCMACHNGVPELAKGADRFKMPDVFPADLPEGIGCQRCHGPGGDHVTLSLQAKSDSSITTKAINASIVDPAKLPMDRQRDLCNSCHFQPSVSVGAQLRLGENAFDFRPGDRLDRHMAQIDITDGRRTVEERFDINHHPYRLEQSACFVETQGALGCLTCHDPHRKLPAKERAAHYRAICLDCHQITEGGPDQNMEHPKLVANSDCTTCHMPDRRTQDVIEVWMTDHRIQRPPAGNLIARIPKEVPVVTGVRLIDRADDLRHGEDTIYNTMAVLAYTSGKADFAADALARVLEEHNPPYFEPWLALANARLRAEDHQSALAAAARAADLAPDHPEPYKLAGLAQLGMGDHAAALRLTEASLDLAPGQAVQHLNKAVIHRALGERDAALAEARRAAELQLNLWSAWRLIGEVTAELGDNQTAIRAFEQALAIEPRADRVRAALIALLEADGHVEEAERHRGLRVIDPQD